MATLLFFISLFSQLALATNGQEIILITHPTSEYDHYRVSQRGIENLLAEKPHARSVLLSHAVNYPSLQQRYFIRHHQVDQTISSGIGYLFLDLSGYGRVYLSGGFLGQCLCRTFMSLLPRFHAGKEVIFYLDGIYSEQRVDNLSLGFVRGIIESKFLGQSSCDTENVGYLNSRADFYYRGRYFGSVQSLNESRLRYKIFRDDSGIAVHFE